MSDEQNTPQTDSVDLMLESLTEWFETPVAPVTPDSELDAMLNSITNTTESREYQEPKKELATVASPGIQPYVTNPHDNRLAGIFREWLDSLKSAFEAAIEFAELHTLLPLTDWQESAQGHLKNEEAVFHMLLQDFGTERKILLEAKTAGTYAYSDTHSRPSPWTFRLLKQHQARWSSAESRSGRIGEGLADEALDHLVTWTFKTQIVIVAFGHGEMWDEAESSTLYDTFTLHNEAVRKSPHEEVIQGSFHPPEPSILLMCSIQGGDSQGTEYKAATIDVLPHAHGDAEHRDIRAALAVAREQISNTLRELTK